ncbi:MAG TPA: SBBP repeat-containing protein, partial [Pyrinomonadaceae bacterium]|nr:SBBP repeat-containing protein [Pyrinomonadaceae bacterium]
DLVYYGNGKQLEYDLIVAPGADPNVVALSYEGAQNIKVDRDGNLVLKTAAGDLRQLKPVVYQEVNGKRKLIEGRYQVRGKNSVGFRLSRYDRTKPLVIDPILVYSSLVNAGGYGAGIAVDSNGYAYITGYTFQDFNPTAGAFQTIFTGDYCVFVTKVNQTGTGVVYSTYLGGNGQAEAYGIAVDSAGSAYVTGYASGSFPTTVGSYQPTLNSSFDAFVTKLNATGSALAYSTFYGGSEFEEGLSIAVDAAGNAYVAGDSGSRNLVTTVGAVQANSRGGTESFVLRLNSTGSALGYATYLGGGGSDLPVSISVDSANNIYVAGETSSFNFAQVNALQSPNGVNRGLFKSTNNGTSWSLSNSGLQNSQVTAIVINPITTAIMYAGTIGGVYKTVNGGATWIASGPTNGGVRALAIDPTNPSIVYAGTNNGVYKTTDAGATWAQINNGIIFQFSGVAYPITVRSIAIDPSNPAIVYAATSLGFYKTTDGGASWTRFGTGAIGLTSTNVQTVVIDPITPSTIYAGFNSTGVFMSTNSGANWTAMNTGLATSSSRNIRSMAILPNAPGTLYVGTLAGIFKTTNGGANWTAVNNGLLVPYSDASSLIPESTNAIVIDPLNPNNVYAGATNSALASGAYPLTSVIKSTDGGANWTAITNGFSGLNNGVFALAINLSDPSILYVGNAGDFDGYATKINANGTSFNYSTIVGSSRNDYVAGIVPDAAGNSYLFGGTGGTNFPITPGAFDSTLSGFYDTFAMKLNSTGTARLYSTYLGGTAIEDSYGLAVDAAGNAHVIGYTTSADFPVTAGAFQSTLRSTGGGTDAFVTKLNATGTALSYSSFLGGAGDELFDFQGNNIALDPLGNAYVVGYTSDINTFPSFGFANAFSDTFGPSITFVAKIDGGLPSYSITGRLTTAANAPIAGVLVQVSNATFYRSTFTDSDGYYAIVSLPAGDYMVAPSRTAASGHYVFSPTNRSFPGLNSNQTANFTGTQAFDIFGKVTSSTVPGLGLFDVTLTLSGASSAIVTSDAEGNYVFRDLLPGDYTITPSKAGFTFDPVNLPITITNADRTAADFTSASGTFFSVTGHIADAANAAIANVLVTMTASSQVGSRTQTTLTDASGDYQFANLQAGGNYTFVPTRAQYLFTPESQAFPNLSGNQIGNFAGGTWQPVVLTAVRISEFKAWTVGGRTYVYVKPQFPDAGYRILNWGQTSRVGNDFTADANAEKFTGPSIQAEVTTAQIYDLGPLANGTYNFNFKTSGTLAKALEFTVSSAVPLPNPIDNSRDFVKQQYQDFLNRDADPAGEDFWTDNINKCNDPARRPPGQTVEQCTLRQRETTSAAFFLSPEFQDTGYFVYRMYVGGLGRQPKLSEFKPDASTVGNGIIVNGQLSGTKINQNKAAFAASFVNCVDASKYRCAEFKARYDALSNQAYVDKLFQNTGVNASAADRTALVNGLDGATETRATVLQKIVDGINVIAEGNQQFTTTYGQAFYNSELNRAFVELEYFGYMKRDPDEAGYAFWLAKLNLFNGNFVNAEMVLAFISSPEYRARFGQP